MRHRERLTGSVRSSWDGQSRSRATGESKGLDLVLLNRRGFIFSAAYLTFHQGERPGVPWRAWKSFGWSSLDRLHDKGLILDPVGKAKSVALTDEGHRRCEEAFRRLFTRPD